MNSPTETNGLNGLRVPLIIDGVVILTAIISGTTMWNKLEFLERQYASSVSAEKIAEMKGQINLLDDQLKRAVLDLRNVDEASRRDRQALHERIERLERDRQR